MTRIAPLASDVRVEEASILEFDLFGFCKFNNLPESTGRFRRSLVTLPVFEQAS